MVAFHSQTLTRVQPAKAAFQNTRYVFRSCEEICAAIKAASPFLPDSLTDSRRQQKAVVRSVARRVEKLI
jgi:hypothetical protein